MSLPYILEEKSVIRKENSTYTITEVIQQAKDWIEELQEATSLDNKYFYANVYDSEAQKKYFVYTDAATEYFDLTSYVVEFLESNENDKNDKNDINITNSIVKDAYLSAYFHTTQEKDSVVPLELEIYGTLNKDQILDSSVILKKGRSYYISGGIVTQNSDNNSYIVSSSFYNKDNEIVELDIPRIYSYINISNDTRWNRIIPMNRLITPSEDLIIKFSLKKVTDDDTDDVTININIIEYSTAQTYVNLDSKEIDYKIDEEVLTDKRWIDGKPIYRKVISYIPENDDPILLEITDAETSINYHTLIKNESDALANVTDIFGYTSSKVDYARIICRKNDNNLTLDIKIYDDRYFGITQYVTIEYTKINDTIDSPIHVKIPVDVYSEEETLTNKVYKGKPVYRKIEIFGDLRKYANDDNSYNTIPWSVSDNMDELIFANKIKPFVDDIEFGSTGEWQYRDRMFKGGFTFVCSTAYDDQLNGVEIVIEYTKI